METRSTEIQKSNGQHRPASAGVRVAAPPVDVFENEQEILIVADVPGAKPDAIAISLDGSELTLEAPRAGHATLRRTFQVPRTVDPERVSADMNAGVLTIRLGKREEARPRRIEVKSSE